MLNMKQSKRSLVSPEQLTTQDTLKNIYHSIRPVYFVCKAVGLFPFRFSTTVHQLKALKSDWAYFGLFILLYVLLSAYSLIVIVLDEENYVVVSKSVVLIECTTMISLMFVVVICTFLTRSLLIKGVNLLANIDLSFAKNGLAIEYGGMLKNNYIMMLLMGISLVCRSILMLLTVQVDWVQKLTLVIAVLIKALSKYQFIAVVLQLQIRFDKINAVIREFYNINKSTCAKLILDPIAKEIPRKLYILCRLHYKLANVIRQINAAFAIQLLGSIAVSLFDILFQAYYLYYVLAGKAPSVKFVMIACPTLWLIDEIIEIYLLVYACASTSDNANETPSILHELRNNYLDIELESDIQTYSLQMLHQEVQFSVLGFFVIDYTLIYSIVGAVTTYLVIFIQFDQSSSAPMVEEDFSHDNDTDIKF